jgi:hypothetical protein
MEGLMSKFIKTAVLAVAFAAMVASSASAATGPAMLKDASPTGTASNLAAISGNAAAFPAHTFTATSAQVSCAHADFHILGVTTNTATIKPTYTSCNFLLNGTPLAAATVDTGCHWTLLFHTGVFNSTTGAGTGGSAFNCATQVTVPAIGCTLDVFAQTRPGISSQNINAAGGNDTSATPWGSKVIANVTGLTYTTTGSCPGLSEHGNDAAYAGTVAVKNVWGSL